MKTWLMIGLYFIANAVVADEVHFSTQTGILTMPSLVADGSAYYENVVLELDFITGQFTIVDGTPADFPEGPYQTSLDFAETGLLINAASLSFTTVVSDSRCPLTVICITAGEVEVTLELQATETNQVFVFNLALEGGGENPEIPGQLVNGWYFRLLEVTPYPVNPGQIDDADYSIVVQYSPQLFDY